jgi:hypothetical protein
LKDVTYLTAKAGYKKLRGKLRWLLICTLIQIPLLVECLKF